MFCLNRQSPVFRDRQFRHLGLGISPTDIPDNVKYKSHILINRLDQTAVLKSDVPNISIGVFTI